jgi:hypothetical protein
VALSGLGGVGKTQTAVEYAYPHLSKYNNAFFVTAASRGALTSRYAAIAGMLTLMGSDATLDMVVKTPWVGSNSVTSLHVSVP